MHELLSALLWVPLVVMLAAWLGANLHRATRRVADQAHIDRPEERY